MIPVLPLVKARDIEALKSWSDILTPQDLLEYITKMLGVDPNQILQFEEIEFSSVQPQGQSRKKIWVDTDGAPSIGVLVGSSYQLFYQYPPNVPLLWTQPESDFPQYLTRLSTDQMEEYGLELPEGSSLFYFMLVV